MRFIKLPLYVCLWTQLQRHRDQSGLSCWTQTSQQTPWEIKNKLIKVSKQVQEVYSPTETDVQSRDTSVTPVNPISLIKNTGFAGKKLHGWRKHRQQRDKVYVNTKVEATIWVCKQNDSDQYSLFNVKIIHFYYLLLENKKARVSVWVVVYIQTQGSGIIVFLTFPRCWYSYLTARMRRLCGSCSAVEPSGTPCKLATQFLNLSTTYFKW